MAYLLTYYEGCARPWLIEHDGEAVYSFVEGDRDYAKEVVCRLNNPELIDDAAVAA